MKTPFLTRLAPMAAVRGSRDPLGLQPVWSRLGRQLIHNVTTVSGDLRGWTTLLLGTAIARSYIEEGARPEEDFTELFLKFEQIVAYAREKHDPDRGEGVRGILGVRARLKQHGSRSIPLGQGDDARILGNQRATGVWGQIAAPARSSELVDTRNMRLEPAVAEEIHELYLTRIPNAFDRALRRLMLENHRLDAEGAHAHLLEAVADAHHPVLTAEERSFYRRCVLYASRDEADIQSRLVHLWLGSGRHDRPVNANEVAALADAAQQDDLRAGLDDIRRAESLLAPAEHLFAFLLGRHRQRLDDVIKEIRSTWTLPMSSIDEGAVDLLLPHFQDAYGNSPEDPLRALSAAMRKGDWEPAVYALQAINGGVSERRRGAPWLTLVDGVLDVRMQDEPGDLPTDAWKLQWVHSYYLEPLRRLIVAVEGGQHEG